MAIIKADKQGDLSVFLSSTASGQKRYMEKRRIGMKKSLSLKETIFVASMLFGMFFGAGNLIFPVSMGQLAGRNMWSAAAGFLITGVGLPLLGVAALGVSRKAGLLELSSIAGRRYGLFFTCALYLTIGPFFAIPRCATVSFAVGLERFLPEGGGTLALPVFSLLFFAVVLFFSLRPGEILTWIGKVLNPLFLCFLGILIIRALVSPMGEIAGSSPEAAYASQPFFKGFLEGYNTMDALAGLAFGIVIVNVIRGLGVEQENAVAANTVRAGIFSSVLMAAIYLLVTAVGAQSRGCFPASANGGTALAQIAEHYFGSAGAVILAVTVTMACLKTAVGLITSCGATFERMFSRGPSYRVWAVLFCVLSFLIANLGLNAIIGCSMPVLMFLYPLAVTLILLTLFGRFFSYDRSVYRWVTGCTAVAAAVDFCNALPKGIASALHMEGAARTAAEAIPFAEQGFGWVCPAAAGLVIGLVFRTVKAGKRKDM